MALQIKCLKWPLASMSMLFVESYDVYDVHTHTHDLYAINVGNVSMEHLIELTRASLKYINQLSAYPHSSLK